MARLPQPGGDSGNWGNILNEFLLESHSTDGTLKDIPQSKVTDLVGDLSNKQPLNSDLSAIAALATTSYGRSLLAIDDAVALRDVAGTNEVYTTVLIWDAGSSDYIPTGSKAIAGPKEFRGPTDPATVSGVVLNQYDTWIDTT